MDHDHSTEEDCTCSFPSAAAAWLDMLRPQIKESSMVKYTNIINTYLLPEFGNRQIGSITGREVILFKNRMLFSGGRKGTGLSPRTVTGILSVLKSIFEYASQDKGCPVADIGKITVKQLQKPIRVLSLAEQQKLNGYLCDNMTLTNLGILVCLYTGLRIGEICALKWEDISFDEKCLFVNKTMQRIQEQEQKEPKTYILISVPKSQCSIRRIPIPDGVFQHVCSFRQPEGTYFLTGQPDRYVEPRTMQNRFKAAGRACGLEDVNFHALRHTFATRCVELGFDLKSLSEILGHASVNITLNRYVHPSMELKKKNMDKLSGIFPA